MVDNLQWLALEAKYLDRTQAFYEAFLDLDVQRVDDGQLALAAGDTDVILREPGSVPRGGLHTHYAFSIPADEYDDWYGRLDERFDVVEHSFGDTTSLYFYDPDGNCVELGQSTVSGPGIGGVFEVVLEVENLDTAVELYETIGFETVDMGEDRRRVRMNADSFALELWEPQLGIADARGGVHVDFGATVADPETVVERIRESDSFERGAIAVENLGEGLRLRDPDGHYLTLLG